MKTKQQALMRYKREDDQLVLLPVIAKVLQLVQQLDLMGVDASIVHEGGPMQESMKKTFLWEQTLL